MCEDARGRPLQPPERCHGSCQASAGADLSSAATARARQQCAAVAAASRASEAGAAQGQSDEWTAARCVGPVEGHVHTCCDWRELVLSTGPCAAGRAIQPALHGRLQVVDVTPCGGRHPVERHT